VIGPTILGRLRHDRHTNLCARGGSVATRQRSAGYDEHGPSAALTARIVAGNAGCGADAVIVSKRACAILPALLAAAECGRVEVSASSAIVARR